MYQGHVNLGMSFWSNQVSLGGLGRLICPISSSWLLEAFYPRMSSLEYNETLLWYFMQDFMTISDLISELKLMPRFVPLR